MRPGPANPPDVWAVDCPRCEAEFLPWDGHDCPEAPGVSREIPCSECCADDPWRPVTDG